MDGGVIAQFAYHTLLNLFVWVGAFVVGISVPIVLIVSIVEIVSVNRSPER